MSVEKGGTSSATTNNKTTVNVSTNVTGPPINIAVGSEFLKPVAESFMPIAAGVERGIKTLSNQAQSIADFAQRSNETVTMRQDELEQLIKLVAMLTVAGIGYQLVAARR